MSKNKKNRSENILRLGCYYEMPNGTIIDTIGADGKGSIYCQYENGKSLKVSSSDLAKFKIRLDLKDFPNSKNPLLPYVFDLNWDIKRRQDLIDAFTTQREYYLNCLPEISRIMRENNIKFSTEELNLISQFTETPDFQF